jgi:hypothetical protein
VSSYPKSISTCYSARESQLAKKVRQQNDYRSCCYAKTRPKRLPFLVHQPLLQPPIGGSHQDGNQHSGEQRQHMPAGHVEVVQPLYDDGDQAVR